MSGRLLRRFSDLFVGGSPSPRARFGHERPGMHPSVGPAHVVAAGVIRCGPTTPAWAR